MKSVLLILILFVFSLATQAQYLNWTPINDSDVSAWIADDVSSYYGVYRFGDSEGESELILFDSGIEIIGQIQSGGWNKSDGIMKWMPQYDNLTNISIDGKGNFNSDQYHGQFSIYENNGSAIFCLKIYNSWSLISDNEEDYELGPIMPDPLASYFSGQYVYASYEELIQSNLKIMSSTELKIMRNEIFARYGYIFKDGGEMDTHFRHQDWYSEQYAKVENFLTALEKRNIMEIKKEEALRIGIKN